MKRFEKIFFWIAGGIIIFFGLRFVWLYVKESKAIKNNPELNNQLTSQSSNTGTSVSTLQNRLALKSALNRLV